jgi:hypothetical protein
MAHEPEDLARPDGKGHVVDGEGAAEGLGKPANVNGISIHHDAIRRVD